MRAATDDPTNSVPDEVWAEAVRRAAVIRPPAEASVGSRAAVRAAAGSLGLSIPQIYRLVQRFRSHPVTASLLPLMPGNVKGARRLAPAVEAKLDAAVETIYPAKFIAAACQLLATKVLPPAVVRA